MPTPHIYRASELGGCLKAQIAKQLDYEPSEPPEQFATLFGEGNLHEQAVIDRLEADGYVITDQQVEVDMFIDQIQLQGHLDGVIVTPGHSKNRVLEIKSMSQAAFDDFKRLRWDTPGLIQKYKWQLSAYMVIMNMEALVVIKNRNTGEIRFEGVELPFYSREEIHSRLREAERWVAENQLPLQCDVVNYPCPFFYLHVDDKVEAVVDNEEIDFCAGAYVEAKAAADDADKELKARRQSLIDAIKEKSKIQTDHYAISYYDYRTIARDFKRMKDDGIDVEKYETVTNSKRLRVKETD